MPNIEETLSLLNEFSTLLEGWQFGEGSALSPDLLKQARAWVRLADIIGIKRANAFPDVEGGVQIRFYHRDRILEMTFEIDGNVVLAEDIGKSQIYFNENASLDDLAGKLKEFAERVCLSSELSTHVTSTEKLMSSRTEYFKNKKTAFLYLTPDVQKELVATYASIYRASIQAWLENLQCFWQSKKASSPRTVERNDFLVNLETSVSTTSSTGIKDIKEHS